MYNFCFSRGISDEQSDIGTDFSSISAVFLYQYDSTYSPYTFIHPSPMLQYISNWEPLKHTHTHKSNEDMRHFLHQKKPREMLLTEDIHFIYNYSF
jgi:hypothetical protein